MERNCSRHLSEDRLDRAVFIATTIGYGEVVREMVVDHPQGGLSIRQLTDTGIIIVRSLDRKIVVTMWVASYGQAQRIYGDSPMPVGLKKKIKTNCTKYANLILTTR